MPVMDSNISIQGAIEQGILSGIGWTLGAAILGLFLVAVGGSGLRKKVKGLI